MIQNGPSPQHKAECDCAEFDGGKCLWPMCESDGWSADGRDKLYVGDVITFAGVYARPRWWQFWRWFSKPRQLKLFIVQETK